MHFGFDAAAARRALLWRFGVHTSYAYVTWTQTNILHHITLLKACTFNVTLGGHSKYRLLRVVLIAAYSRAFISSMVSFSSLLACRKWCIADTTIVRRCTGSACQRGTPRALACDPYQEGRKWLPSAQMLLPLPRPCRKTACHLHAGVMCLPASPARCRSHPAARRARIPARTLWRMVPAG